MKLKEVSTIGQAFRMVNACSIFVVSDIWHPLFGMKVINLDLGIQHQVSGSDEMTGEEEIELVTLLPIALEPEDLQNLDRIIEIEGENESRASRAIRLLEGDDGAIAIEANYLQTQTFHS